MAHGRLREPVPLHEMQTRVHIFITRYIWQLGAMMAGVPSSHPYPRRTRLVHPFSPFPYPLRHEGRTIVEPRHRAQGHLPERGRQILPLPQPPNLSSDLRPSATRNSLALTQMPPEKEVLPALWQNPNTLHYKQGQLPRTSCIAARPSCL